MSYRTIASTDSENEHFSESIDMRPSFSKTKPGLKRAVEKTSAKKPMKKKQNKLSASYRDNVTERLRSEEFDVELINSLTFRQGDGIVTIKTPFEEKGTELWVISHYKVANIENVPVKDRWKFSEATNQQGIRIKTSAPPQHTLLPIRWSNPL
ncbi:unnamed protein product [Macrosiphum euphorbiae]|uniref:Uncharacterized protein n=1 Tax=Macrosiphum euphorbiae TaxID=13131 RepID=A0AAV0XBM2_9HEMI|nr:unnamed protein product [Macrosiphum euphorbiae]